MLLFGGCQKFYLHNFSLHIIPVTKVIRHLPPTLNQYEFINISLQSNTSVADAYQGLMYIANIH